MLNDAAHKRKREESIKILLDSSDDFSDDETVQVMRDDDETNQKTISFRQLKKKKALNLVDVLPNNNNLNNLNNLNNINMNINDDRDGEQTTMKNENDKFNNREEQLKKMLNENTTERRLKEYFYSKGLKVDDCVGSGGFGSVFTVLIGENRKAIKCITNSSTVIGFQELANSIQLDHEHIVKVDDFHIIEGMVCLEMEFMEKGSLVSYKRKLTDSMLIQIVAQVCDALSYISKKNICHRDIKPGNLLVRSIDFDLESIQVVVGDFGLSFSQKSIKEVNDGGTLSYMDPIIFEYIENLKKIKPEERKNLPLPYGIDTDLYSLGVTIEQLVGNTPTDFIRKIVETLKNPNRKERVSFMHKMAAISQAYTQAFKNPNNSTLWHKHLEAASIHPFCMELSPYQHKHFVLEVLKRNGIAIQYVYPEYRKDTEVVLQALRQNVWAITTISEELNQDPKLEQVVKQNLGWIKPEIRNRFSRGENRHRDLDFYLNLVKYNEETIIFIPEEMKWNREYLLKFVSVNGACLQYLRDYMNDLEFFKIALQNNLQVIEFAPPSIRDDLEIMNEIIEKDPELFSYASARLKGNRDLALKSVTLNPYRNFGQIHKDLKTNSQFLIDVITNNPSIIEQTAWFDPSLPFYDELASQALSLDRDLFFKLPFEKRKSKAILREFFETVLVDMVMIEEVVDILSGSTSLDEEALQQLKERYLDDQQKGTIRKILLSILSVDRYKIPMPFLIELFSEDRDFIESAVEYGQDFFQIACNDLKCQDEFLATCIDKGVNVSQFPKEKRSDAELMKRAILKDPNNFRHLDENLKESIEMIQLLLSNYPKLFNLIPSHLQYEKEIIKIAIQCGYRNYNNLASQAFTDENILKLDVKGLLPFVSQNYLRNHSEFLLESVKITNEIKYLDLLPDHYKDNEQVMIEFVKYNGLALEYCSPTLRSTKEFVQVAVKQNEMALQFASPSLQVDHSFICEFSIFQEMNRM
ncbi:predicted protein [Naegleria gruberi]|uniref:Predicted protein n=1 Tax=Naegleria gruberi TaxID=5762 RepID=D2VBS9_NAEGR|nr:uncharacterized protein NAEGRDRAFT_48268 [Naegleria gruberi]EFC45641.1 predicted protein [Naegleria gruberi]|eukprot:XP_002678385.1 predicted protein [Naegleria gruberi strain NEG-M]